MIVLINQANSLIDRGSELFSYNVVIPMIRATYHGIANSSIAITEIFSKNISRHVYNAFYDPLNASTILAVTRSVENLAGRMAIRHPKSSPYLLHYIDQSLISMSQSIKSYTERINDLLVVPENLKKFFHSLTTESFLYQFTKNSSAVITWTNSAIIQIRRFALAILDLIVGFVDLFVKTLFLGVNFGPFSYAREIICDLRNNVKAKFSEVAIRVVERKVTKLRKLIISNTADAVTQYLVNKGVLIVAKSLVGLAIYLPIKTVMTQVLHAPERSVHVLAASIISCVLWVNLIKPTCDPYYENYKTSFNIGNLSFAEFSKYYGIEKFNIITSFVGKFFNNLAKSPS